MDLIIHQIFLQVLNAVNAMIDFFKDYYYIGTIKVKQQMTSAQKNHFTEVNKCAAIRQVCHNAQQSLRQA